MEHCTSHWSLFSLFIYNLYFRSKRVTQAPEPNTQVSSRNDIFNQKEEQVDSEALQEDAKRMDLLMRQLMGGDDEEGNQIYSIRRKKKKKLTRKNFQN